MLLRLDKVSLAYGSRPLLDQVSLQLEESERIALIGRNGEGKSSMLRLLLRETEPDEGVVWIKSGARLGHLAQDISVLTPVPLAEWLSAALTDSGAGSASDEGWSTAQRVATVLSRLRLDGAAQLDQLSGGTRRRALLARALVSDPQILLLDEPTNHLDIDTIEWLERFLLEFRGLVLFVSHDRTFIDHLATRIVELDRGNLTAFRGNYEAYQRAKSEQLAVESQHAALFDKKLAQEEAWIRQGVEARRTRNEGRVRALYALRSERRARRERGGRLQLEAASISESGSLVFETENLSVGFAGRIVIRDLSMRIMRGDRIGLVGPNGAGKTTLIRTLLGELEPTAGKVRQGSRLEIAYYDQERLQLNLEASVSANVGGYNDHVVVNGQSRHVAGYLRDFLFRPEQLNTPARALSGGERNRLLLVSHDRAFLDNVVTSLLVFEGEGVVRDFVGGYSDWKNYRDQRDAAAQPAKPAPTAMSASRPANRGARLSYQAQRELTELPDRLQGLEAEKAEIESRLADSSLYRGGAEELQTRLQRLADITAELETGYARWATLEALAPGGR